MPQYLALTATLSGVTSLAPVDTKDSPFWYTFTIQCTSCRETHPSDIGISRYESNEISGSKGTAHFVWRCKNCKREHSANIKTAVGTGGEGAVASGAPYEASEPPKRQKILEIDGRGIDLEAFKPEGDWTCVGIDSGTKFESVDLSEGEWYDYDDKAGQEVSITDVKWEIRRNI